MTINYDPDKIPELNRQTFLEGRSLGLIPVNVYCVEPGDDSGDATGVSFTAFVNFIPRAGDRIILEDDTTCEVKRIYYKVAKNPGSALITLVPNIQAIRVTQQKG